MSYKAYARIVGRTLPAWRFPEDMGVCSQPIARGGILDSGNAA